MVPVTVSGWTEQLLSIDANEGAAVAVALGGSACRLASEASAWLARWASTPVPAARPTTVTARMAMTIDNTKTRTVQPNGPWRCTHFPLPLATSSSLRVPSAAALS